jgi:uncharacterized protein YbjT (DUF2867 family)
MGRQFTGRAHPQVRSGDGSSRRLQMAGAKGRVWSWIGGIVLILALVVFLLWPPPHASGITADNAGHAPELAGNSAAQPLRILVIGGTSGVGLETVRLALARGHTVTAMSRRAPAAPLQGDRLHYVQGDITRATDVLAAAANQDAIVTAVSIDPTRRPVSLFSIGTRNVLDTMGASGTKRLIAITGIGAGDSRNHGGFGYDRVFFPLMLRTIYEDKDREEAAIRASSVDWTIVRPGHMTHDAAAHGYWVVHDLTNVSGGAIARADVAHYIVAAIEGNLDSRGTVALVN